MLPKNQRLNLNKDFKWVASGKKINSKLVNLFIRMGDNGLPKVGIAVSNKTFRKSSQRNRVRRVVSQAFEVLYPKLPGNINIVALPKVGILDVKSGDVLLELEVILKNI